MLLCLNDSNCADHGIHPNNALTLPIVGAILYDSPSLRSTYFCIFISLASIGLISNIFSLITFMRDRIRFTVCGVYLTLFATCGILLMMLFLTNIVVTLQYDDYLFRLWTCHGYPYLFLVVINIAVLMSAAIIIENILNRYFDFDRFRSRRCAVFTSFNLFLFVSISNLDKIFARRLISDHSGHLYCVYDHHSSPVWLYINHTTSYLYMIISSLVHFISIIFILSKIKQQKQKSYRKLVEYQELLLPSFLIVLCLCPYIMSSYFLNRYITNSSRLYIRLHVGFLLILYIPQILTFVIYVLPNQSYCKAFGQSWIVRRLCSCYNGQRQIQEFEAIHSLWHRRTSLETAMTIFSLNDSFVESELYNKIKLEV